MNPAKVNFSADEMELARNSHWLLTKNTIIDKVYSLFGEYSAYLQGKLLDASLETGSPKISRGEKYKGLPYVMLDYPRLFSHNEVCAIRTMFWWGKYLSVTLHLKGAAVTLCRERIADRYSILAASPFFVARDEDEWNHDLQTEQFIPVSNLHQAGFSELLKQSRVIRISLRMGLDRMNEGVLAVSDTFDLMLEILGVEKTATDQLPSR
jgi:hypothetical protein